MTKNTSTVEMVRTFWIVSKSQKQKVKKAAEKYNISESEVIRDLITKMTLVIIMFSLSASIVSASSSYPPGYVPTKRHKWTAAEVRANKERTQEMLRKQAEINAPKQTIKSTSTTTKSTKTTEVKKIEQPNNTEVINLQNQVQVLKTKNDLITKQSNKGYYVIVGLSLLSLALLMFLK